MVNFIIQLTVIFNPQIHYVMRKILLLSVFILSSFIMVEAQNNHLYARGGYSWINGVVGGEMFVNKISFGGGWMPNRSQISGKMLTTICGQVSFHASDPEYDPSVYLSLGFASNGYQYTDDYGRYRTETMLVILLGYRYYTGKRIDFKLGAGYGFYDGGGTLTGEIGIGVKIF